MAQAEGVVLSGGMTRRLEPVLLVMALVAVTCTLALTSVTAGLADLLR